MLHQKHESCKKIRLVGKTLGENVATSTLHFQKNSAKLRKQNILTIWLSQ